MAFAYAADICAVIGLLSDGRLRGYRQTPDEIIPSRAGAPEIHLRSIPAAEPVAWELTARGVHRHTT